MPWSRVDAIKIMWEPTDIMDRDHDDDFDSIFTINESPPSESPPVACQLLATPERELLNRQRFNMAKSFFQTPKGNTVSRIQLQRREIPRPSPKTFPESSFGKTKPVSKGVTSAPPSHNDPAPTRRPSVTKPTNAPPDNPRSVHIGAALTPKDLDDLFRLLEEARRDLPALFQSPAETPSASVADSSVESTAIVNNLSSRQRTTRGTLVQPRVAVARAASQPSSSPTSIVSKLKSEIDLLRQSSVRAVQRLAAMQNELDSVSRERQSLKNRQVAQEETIHRLKEDLDQATLAASSNVPADAATHSTPLDTQKELVDLRAENELFASQIIENEVELREIRTILAFMEQENRQMHSALEALELNLDKDKAAENPDLAGQIEALKSRISTIEHHRDMSRRSFEHDCRGKNKDEQTGVLSPTDSELSCVCPKTSDTFVNEGIEVTIHDKPKKKKKKFSRGVVCCDFLHLMVMSDEGEDGDKKRSTTSY